MAGFATLLFAAITTADVLEDVETRVDQGVGEIRLVFSTPVRYLKHFPAEQGELLKVYLQTMTVEKPGRLDLQGVKRSPALSLVPAYTVTYTTARTCYAAREPVCLDIQFTQPVHYRLKPGEDGHSLVIHILPETDPPRAPAKR